jgi:competence protein ComEA
MDLPPEPSPRATVAAFLLVTLAIAGGIVLLLSSRPEPVHITIIPPQPIAPIAPTATPSAITVYVTGAVAQPGILITLASASRVADAVQAAGGSTDDADLSRVNLAAPLRDGDQVHVPRVGEAFASATEGLIPINTATVEELVTLPGVGPVLAQAIVDYRAANGLFTSLEDLDAVTGVGPSLLEDLAPLITFE